MTRTYVLYIALVFSASLSGFLFGHKLGAKPQGARLSAAASAGVLLGLCFLYVLPESFEHLVHGGAMNAAALSSGFIEIGFLAALGFLVLLSVERYLLRIDKHASCASHDDAHGFHASHEHGGIGSAAVALALHSFFDGVALRAAADVQSIGFALAMGIVLHKIPEAGSLLVVLRRGGIRRSVQVLICSIYLCATPLGLLVSHRLHSILSGRKMGWIMAFATGAFFHLITGHLLPETTESDGKTTKARTYGVMILGFTIVSVARFLTIG